MRLELKEISKSGVTQNTENKIITETCNTASILTPNGRNNEELILKHPVHKEGQLPSSCNQDWKKVKVESKND